jgi:hypothetical protein
MGFVFTGCATHRCCKIQEWEYKIVSANKTDEKDLNNLGKEGWLLVNVVPVRNEVNRRIAAGTPTGDSDVYIESSYIFKRPIH